MHQFIIKNAPRLERFLLSGRGRFVSVLRRSYLARKRQEFLDPYKPNKTFPRAALLMGLLTGTIGYNYLVYKRAKLVTIKLPTDPLKKEPEQVTVGAPIVESKRPTAEIPTQKKIQGRNQTDEILPIDKISTPSLIYSWLFGKKSETTTVEITEEQKIEPEPETVVIEEIRYAGRRKPLVANEVIGALKSLGIRDKAKLQKLQERLSNIQYVDQLDLHSLLKGTVTNENEVLAFERLYYFNTQKYTVEDIQLDYDDSLRDIKIDIVTGKPIDPEIHREPIVNHEALASAALGGGLFYLLAKFRYSPPTQSLHSIGKSLGRISVVGFALYGLCAVMYNKYFESEKRFVPYSLKWDNGILSKVCCTHNCARRIQTPASFLSSYFIPGTIVTFLTGYVVGGLYGAIYFFIPI